MVPKAIMDEALALDVFEKLKLIDALQRSLDPSLYDEVGPDEAALVDQALADPEATSGDGVSWEELKAEMQARLL